MLKDDHLRVVVCCHLYESNIVVERQFIYIR